MSEDEDWTGEREYYSELRRILEKKREQLGICHKQTDCVKFYKKIKHEEWSL